MQTSKHGCEQVFVFANVFADGFNVFVSLFWCDSHNLHMWKNDIYKIIRKLHRESVNLFLLCKNGKAVSF